MNLQFEHVTQINTQQLIRCTFQPDPALRRTSLGLDPTTERKTKTTFFKSARVLDQFL